MKSKPYITEEIEVLTAMDAVRIRPSMYIGKKSLYGLRCMLFGAQLCGHCERTTLQFNCLKFEAWVSENKGDKKRPLAIQSYDIALAAADQDDQKGFDEWFKLYDEYMRATTGSAPASNSG